MADESSILSILSSNSHVKRHMFLGSKEHTHSKSMLYIEPTFAKPRRLPAVSAAYLTRVRV